MRSLRCPDPAWQKKNRQEHHNGQGFLGSGRGNGRQVIRVFLHIPWEHTIVTILLPPAIEPFDDKPRRWHPPNPHDAATSSVCTNRRVLGPAFDDVLQKKANPGNSGPPSVSFKRRFFLGYKGFKGTGEIFGLHADRLGLGLGLDGLVQTHVPFLIEHRLGH